MKKGLFILIVLVSSKCLAQHDSAQIVAKREIKMNLFNLIAFQAADLSFESILNENQSLGLGVLIKLKPLRPRAQEFSDTEISYSRNFSLTPYYRYFLSKKFAKGVFIEGFAMYATGKEFEDISFYPNEPQEFTSEKYKVFRLGISLGIKIIIRKNLPLDINFGMGIDPFRINYVWLNPATRGGISFGFRF